ncbi:MAG TPA: hypothetical protein VLS96_02885, partial [Nodosilinea sp.]|nr:hypothetical protein [Nodosilinea sp.]
FDLPLIPAAEAEADRDRTPAIEAHLVRELSHLLYFLLTGQRAEHTNAPLAVDLRRRRPELPTSLDQALELGSPRRPESSADGEPQSALTLADWGRLLPAIADLPADLPQPSPTVRPAPPPAPSAEPKTLVASLKPDRAVATPASRSRPLPVLALAFTGLLATASGLGFGLYARLQPRQSTSQQRLNPNQSFPPLPDWNSDALWQPWDEAPALRQRPDYSTTPPQGSEPAVDFTPNPQEPAAPPPAVTQPELVEPEPAAAPAETWEMPEQPEFQPLPDPTIIDPTLPAPVPTPEVAPAPSAPPPLAPPPAPPAPEGAAPPPLNLPPRPAAPAPAAG